MISGALKAKRYDVYPVECCNYRVSGAEVPDYAREIYLEETCETLKIDYTNHALGRWCQNNRHFELVNVVSMLKDAADEILGLKPNQKFLLIDKRRSMYIVGSLHLSNVSDTYILALITVVVPKDSSECVRPNLNKAFAIVVDSVNHTARPFDKELGKANWL